MTMKLKTLKTALLSAALALMSATAARADANPANDSGTFTIRITPNVDLGVTVDTTGAAWEGSSNLDMTQTLGSDVRLLTPVSITMAGNLNNQELTLTGAALNTWTLDTDESDESDKLRLYAMFGKSPVTTPLAVGDYAGAQNLITTVATRAGQPQADEGGDTNHVYELPLAHGEYADVDGMTATATRKLWLRSSTPSTSSTEGQAAFTITVNAVSGAGL